MLHSLNMIFFSFQDLLNLIQIAIMFLNVVIKKIYSKNSPFRLRIKSLSNRMKQRTVPIIVMLCRFNCAPIIWGNNIIILDFSVKNRKFIFEYYINVIVTPTSYTRLRNLSNTVFTLFSKGEPAGQCCSGGVNCDFKTQQAVSSKYLRNINISHTACRWVSDNHIITPLPRNEYT